MAAGFCVLMKNKLLNAVLSKAACADWVQSEPRTAADSQDKDAPR